MTFRDYIIPILIWFALMGFAFILVYQFNKWAKGFLDETKNDVDKEMD